jgi:hypothetical protein
VDSSSTCVQHYGRRRSKHGTTQEQSPQERAYHCSQTKSVITKHAHGAAQRAQEYHGHEQVQHNTPDSHNHEAQGNSDPASDSPLPCCQPSGRPCLPDSTARRDTGRDQEGEERQAMRGSTGTEPSQHKQIDGVGPGRYMHRRPTACRSAGNTAGREVSHKLT